MARHTWGVVPNQLDQRCVVPYYLKMMATNAVEHGFGLIDEIVTVGQSISDEDVIVLLHSARRPRVMGAWFAPLHDREGVRSALLGSLESSSGRLTSPPLAAVASVMCGVDALASLRTYRAADVAHQWGAAPFIDATIERLSSPSVLDFDEFLARPSDRAGLDELVGLTERLRAS